MSLLLCVLGWHRWRNFQYQDSHGYALTVERCVRCGLRRGHHMVWGDW